MKISWKLSMLTLTCAVAGGGMFVHADTGTVVGTGETVTGTIVSTGEAEFTGSLLTYLSTQESNVSVLLTNVYGKLYAEFIKTGLNILKSIDYQSLVCLGAMKDVSLLSQLQKDRTALMIAFKQDFVELENKVLALEEKKALQESDNVNVFDAGTSYESEKSKLKDSIDAKVTLHKGFITAFATGYAAKNTEFLTTFLQYRTANAGLIKGFQDKMNAVQNVMTAFSGVETIISDINARVTGLDELMNKMETSKTNGVSTLSKLLQTIIDTAAKTYKKLSTLADALTQQKSYVVGQLQRDLDEYVTMSIQNRYDRTKYLALKKEVEAYKAKFYTTTNQLNCSNILATDTESAALLAKIAAMKISANSGLVKINAEGISASFKDQAYSGYQSLYLLKFKQRYTEYSDFAKAYIKAALKELTAGSSSDTASSSATITTKYVFTRAFKSGEYAEGIKVLQNLLATLNLYSGAIDGIYSKATKNAVYQFQLSKGLLKGYEKKPSVRGRMGPSTRAALNQLTR